MQPADKVDFFWEYQFSLSFSVSLNESRVLADLALAISSATKIFFDANNMFKTPTQPITLKQADKLKLFQMSFRTLYRRCENWEIETVMINGVRHITPKAVDDYQRSKQGGVTIFAVLDDIDSFADNTIKSDQTKKRIKYFLNSFRKYISQ